MWEDLFNIAKHHQIKNNLKISQDTKMDIEQDHLNKFEEIFENVTIDNLMHIFSSIDQIMSDESVITMTFSQDYKPLGLFQNPNSKECNYPILFFGMPRKPSILAKF
jgi:hypothetical protein